MNILATGLTPAEEAQMAIGPEGDGDGVHIQN